MLFDTHENELNKSVFGETFVIDKDAGEALKFTYQIHLIGEDNCLFGNKFAEHNPLIKDYDGKQRKFKVWLLTKYIRDGVDILETTANDTAYEHTYDNLTNMGAKFELYELSQSQEQLQTYGKAYKLNLLSTVTNALRNGNYKAWAITDESNNLYVGCNDASVKALYFQLHHKR